MRVSRSGGRSAFGRRQKAGQRAGIMPQAGRRPLPGPASPSQRGGRPGRRTLLAAPTDAWSERNGDLGRFWVPPGRGCQVAGSGPLYQRMRGGLAKLPGVVAEPVPGFPPTGGRVYAAAETPWQHIAALYRRYPSKEELIKRLYQENQQLLLAEARAAA